MLLALSVFGAAPALAQQYTLTKIPVPDLSSFPPSADVSGAYVVGHGLNNGGEVVGNVGGVVGNAPTQPFVYNQGSSQLLPYLAKPEDWATASAINLNGIVVGESENTFVQGNAVSWQNGSISFLGSLYYIHGVGSPPPAGYSSAAAINSKGDAVGSALGAAGGSSSSDTHAALYSGGVVTDLGTFGGDNSEALGINDSGIIVGDAQTSSESHAFYYNGTMHDLGVLPGGQASSATAINASGTIVGWSSLSGGTHAVLWQDNGTGDYAIHDLGSLGPLAGNFSQANAVNSSGQVVGISDTPQNDETAFVYSNGKMTDLNSLLPNGSSVSLHEATAINESGQIVAYSLNYTTNVRTTYLLTPNTPPVSVPNVVGLSQTAAAIAIVAAELEVGVVTIQNSPTVPAGIVISQSPTSGSSLRVGAPVNLAVSSGKVSVPNVVGLSSATANPLLTGAGLSITDSFQYSATISGSTPSTTVFAQSPPAGSVVAQGSAVNLVFLTPLSITVPNVVGLTTLLGAPNNAFDVLCAAHFTAVTLSTKPSSTVPEGDVISQSPAPGTVYGIGVKYADCDPHYSSPVVNLVTSSGPPSTLPTVSLSTVFMSFGAQAVATSSAAQQVTLTNTGPSTISLTSITVTGPQADDFLLSKNCGAALASGSSCTMSVIFKPVSAGNKSASITVVDNATGSPQSVVMTGKGGAGGVLSFSQNKLTFPATAAGASSAAQSVTVTNTDSVGAAFSSIAITGAQADDYSLTKTCGATLAAGSTCAISVIFKPVSAGVKSAAITFTDSALGSPQSVPLVGTGASGAATMSVSSSSLTFPAIAAGVSSASQTVTMKNTGSISVSISAIAITGAQADDFGLTETCGSSLAAGSTCTITVTFTPVSTGVKSAALSIADSASGSPQKVTLKGTGT